MNNAISRARADLPLFDKALKSGNRNYNYFAIKKRYRTPDGGGEHIWIARVSAVKQGYTGLVNNDPVNTDEIKYGDTVYVLKDDITDWMYLDSNLLRGGYTMRVELKRMKPDEKAAFLKELDYKIEE
jgi:uncharacterized protein YegJ (DUF2314 family)